MRKHPAIILSAILALSLSSAFLGAQGVPAPYVTRLRIGVNGDLVVLTWEDSPDATGSLRVFRSASPINAENVASASAVGTVPYGQMRFEDRPGTRNEWYYAVASLDEAGVPYPYFLPFKNATAVGVIPESSGADLAAAENFVDVTAISASAASDAVSVRFSAPSAGHRLVVYRSPDPIESSLAVLSASIVSIVEDSATEVMDYPVPGIGYYYAIVDEKRLREGSVDIKPGSNATTPPGKIEPGANRSGPPRRRPSPGAAPSPTGSSIRPSGRESASAPPSSRPSAPPPAPRWRRPSAASSASSPTRPRACRPSSSSRSTPRNPPRATSTRSPPSSRRSSRVRTGRAP